MRRSLLIILFLSFSLFSLSTLPAMAQATITVTSSADNTTTDGACTLREAITNANSNAATFADCVAGTGTGTDTIQFNIAGAGPHVISLASNLPSITSPVFIDGLTQAGADCQTELMIVLNGSSYGLGTGLQLTINASGSTIRGLVIQSFASIGILLNNGDNNRIQCNFIGTNSTGASASANGVGMNMTGGSENNIVGTDGDGTNDANEGNLISANTGNGMIVTVATTINNRIAGNRIGTDRSGTLDLGNGSNGIQLSGSQNNIVGTNGDGVGDAAEGNVISGNTNFGVLVNLGTNNRIAGNLIGTDISGTSSIPNNSGISLQSATGNIVGTNGDGTSDALEGNLLSGNSNNGIAVITGSTGSVIAGNLIGTNITGTADLGNSADGFAITGPSNRVGTNGDGVSDALERNIISGNNGDGIEINGAFATGNVVAGNYIGTNITGTATLSNSFDGIFVTNNANSNIIGTNGDGSGDANEGNLISANRVGILLSGAAVTNNRIAGNLIGTDVTGSLDFGNSNAGILSQGNANNSIIGTNGDGVSDTLEGNVISGNNSGGITLADSDNNRVAGNLIGTNSAGTSSVPNSFGISIQNTATGNIIGTNGDGSGDANEGNTISGNSANGVAIASNSPSNVVAGNRIGTDSAGGFAIGNLGDGVIIAGASNRIGTNNDGTSDALEGNTISGNTSHGVDMLSSTAINNTVAGNIIGLNSATTLAIANGASGIAVQAGASNNTIGGAADAQSNFISGNTARGIYITGANSTGNVINNNYISTNAAQAILPNGTNGIEIDATGTGTTTVTNNWIFYHPTTGILLSNAADLGAAGQSEQNCIVQNTAGLNNTTGINTFFENNWWGSSTGPSGAGTGNGDTVSANVDYIAFLTVPPTDCPGIAGVIINPLAVSAAEGGTTSYTIVLESQPAVGEIVTITIAISGAAAGEIASTDPLTFNFDSTNWNIAQTFDITLADDLIVNGNRSYVAAFTHTSDSTLGTSGYDATAALVIDSVDLDVIDNETPNVVINPTAFSLVVGNSQTYDVSLTVEPASDVTITLTQLDANCTISTTTLTFTNSAGASPWNVPQQVTVTGVGAVGATCTIQHSPAGGGYTGVVASDVVVRLRDLNTPVVNPPATGGEPAIAVFDPAISKLGELLPGQTGIVGEELEWVVTVSNVGTVAGTNVTITDTLIPALQIDSVNAPGGTVTISGQTVTVVYPTLAVGQTVSFSIFTTVLQGATVENTACVNATNQGVQECATAISASVSELPNTGEAPLWRYALLSGIGILLLALGFITIRKSLK